MPAFAACSRLLHGDNIVRSDEDRGRLAGNDRGQDGALERRIKLGRALRRNADAELLRFCVHATAHGDVETITLDTLDEHDLLAGSLCSGSDTHGQSDGDAGGDRHDRRLLDEVIAFHHLPILLSVPELHTADLEVLGLTS